MLGIEAAGGAPVLGVAAVPVRAVPAEGGGEEEARGEFLAGERADAVGEEADGGEEDVPLDAVCTETSTFTAPDRLA